MHTTAMANGKRFFDTYLQSVNPVTVVDIGAQDVNGSLKSVCPPHAKYVGVDFVTGKGVDLVLQDPYKLPFDDETVDAIVSSSCFEHSEMFWVLYLEILRVLKPSGLFYLNAPSNGAFHRYPVDCWRFYPDCGNALTAWAKRNGLNPSVLESYTSNAENEEWRDFVCVFVKDEREASGYRKRITHSFGDFTNGLAHPRLDSFANFAEHAPPTDHLKPQPERRRRKFRWF